MRIYVRTVVLDEAENRDVDKAEMQDVSMLGFCLATESQWLWCLNDNKSVNSLFFSVSVVLQRDCNLDIRYRLWYRSFSLH